MRKILYTLLAVIMIFTASTSSVTAQIEVNRKVSGFNSIVSEAPFEVRIKVDGTESIKISTDSASDADAIPLIETNVVNGVLKIKYKDDLKDGQGNTSGSLIVYVTAKSLYSIVKNGAGYIKVKGMVTANSFSIVVNGSGNIESSVKTKVLNATITSSGSIDLNGNADAAKILINGAGSLNARDLKTLDASVVITGAGSAYFRADKTISAHVTGTGDVYYSGNAVITAGSDKIIKD